GGISLFVKRKGGKNCRICYARRAEMETAEEKLSFLSAVKLGGIRFDEVHPDVKHNWLNQANNDFDSLIPIGTRETKAAKAVGQERAIFKLFSRGVATMRDDWMYDFDADLLKDKVQYFTKVYSQSVA